MSSQEIADLVNGFKFPNESQWKKFLTALEGKSMDELNEIDKLIQELPDGLSQGAIVFIAGKKAKILAPEFKTISEANWIKFAKRVLDLFWRPWTVGLLESSIKSSLGPFNVSGEAYHVLAIVSMGPQEALPLLELYEQL
jgi:hypothetical protein